MVKNICLSLLFVACFVSASSAAGIGGTYTWSLDQYVKVIKVVKQDEKTILFSAVTSDGKEKGCNGGLRATKAQLNGNVATFKGEDGFVMKMIFQGSKMLVTEEGNSTKYHPKACNYAARYTLKVDAAMSPHGGAPKQH
jgi:hypothetical protein